MKAIILAGGRGKRLRPITDKIPKPLIPINNKPLIERTIKYLKKYGITEIIISSGYKSNLIEKFLKKKKNFGCDIVFSIEKTPLELSVNSIFKRLSSTLYFENFIFESNKDGSYNL